MELAGVYTELVPAQEAPSQKDPRREHETNTSMPELPRVVLSAPMNPASQHPRQSSKPWRLAASVASYDVVHQSGGSGSCAITKRLLPKMLKLCLSPRHKTSVRVAAV